jgi:hypothetical protein
VYPIDAWEGTVVAEFGKLCADDNNVPRKLYAEAFRCALGAVVGDRLLCPDVEGAFPRSFTFIIAPAGKGKGSAIRRAVDFFKADWASRALSLTPGLLTGASEFVWKPKGLGARLASASSVPGLSRLLSEPKDIGSRPHMAWGDTFPRIFTVHEEAKTFFSSLFIEGGVGSALEGVVCQLWDDTDFYGTATGTRDAVFGQMLFSMLCGVTEQDWFDLLSRGNVVGGGLMSRLNLVGTEGEYENVDTMRPPDFTALRETFLPRIVQLGDAHVRIRASDEARQVMAEWTRLLPEGSVRLNVQAWRSALLLAWLRHEETVSAKAAEDAVQLAQYQAASHEYYRPMPADTANAKVQAKIVRQLKVRGRMDKRKLQKCTNAHRDGTELWTRALDGLLRDRTIGKGEDGTLYLAED